VLVAVVYGVGNVAPMRPERASGVKADAEEQRQSSLQALRMLMTATFVPLSYPIQQAYG